MKLYVVNSFTYQGHGGNPAGIVLDFDSELKDFEMQDIARSAGFSETAFIRKGHVTSDFDIRFFTPTDEVDLCGHATVASFWFLSHMGFIVPGSYTQKTKAGLLRVQVIDIPSKSTERRDFKVIMEQASPKKRAAETWMDERFKLSFPSYTPHGHLPLEVWSTGLEDLLLPLEHLEDLHHLEVDFPALSEYSRHHNLVGVHAFCIGKHQIHVRNFAPLYGINEESATGTSNGALAAYLHEHLYPELKTLEIDVLQGEAMQATSLIQVISEKSDAQHTVWVGGQCHFIAEIEI